MAWLRSGERDGVERGVDVCIRVDWLLEGVGVTLTGLPPPLDNGVSMVVIGVDVGDGVESGVASVCVVLEFLGGGKLELSSSNTNAKRHTVIICGVDALSHIVQTHQPIRRRTPFVTCNHTGNPKITSSRRS